MWSVLATLQRHLVWAVTVAMVAGFLGGWLWDARPLRSLILPVTILMVYPIMVTLDVRGLFSQCHWRLLGLVQLGNLVILPLAGWGLGRLFLADEPVRAFGLLLMATLPTSGMTISWTKFAHGHVGAAVKMSVLGLVLGGLLVPFYAWLLMGQAVDLSLASLVQKVLLVIFVPLLAGQATGSLLRSRLGPDRYDRDWKPHFPQLSTVAVLAIIALAMALRARAIVADPLPLLKLVPPLVAFYVLAYALSILAARRWLPRDQAVVLVFSTAMRNLSLALALAMTVLGPRGAGAALVVALAFVLQVQSAAWLVRRSDRVFGPVETTV
ncbi:MAG: bile acid:sodium symporter [Candidatus Krumholzibacteriia bacterium]